jgi:hypothetical protein
MDQKQIAILEQIYKGEQLRQALDWWKKQVPDAIKQRIPVAGQANYVVRHEYLWLDKKPTEGGDNS